MTRDALWDGDRDPWTEPEATLDDSSTPAPVDDEPPHEKGRLPEGCAEATYLCVPDVKDAPIPCIEATFLFHRTETHWLYVWCGIDAEHEIGPGEARQILYWEDFVATMTNAHPHPAGEPLHLDPCDVPRGPMLTPPSRIVIVVSGITTNCALLSPGRGWPL